MNEIWSLDATAQAELVTTGQASASDLVATALERASELASLGATTVLFEKRAMQRAEHATGPFAGVPILLKDAGQQLEGTPYWMGTTALKSVGYRSELTTLLTHQLEALGFVIIGKAAVPELMTGVTTEPPTGPPTRNPWNELLTVGGSSGGSAAAVAAGIVPIAHGSDSTGSLRYPASCCGVFSLKPTAGRVSSQLPADIEDPLNMHADFVLSRTVRDLRGVLNGLASNGQTAANPLRRIGVLDAMPFGLEAAQEVHDAIAETAGRLAQSHELVPVRPDFLERYGAALGKEIPTMVDAHRFAAVAWIERRIGRKPTNSDLSQDILDAATRGSRQTTSDLSGAQNRVRLAAQEAAGWTDEVDVLLLPILNVMPWPLGEPEPDGLLAGLVCSLANFTGQPSVAIPTVQGGLPVGVQLQGQSGRDEELLDLAAVVRSSAPAPAVWRHSAHGVRTP